MSLCSECFVNVPIMNSMYYLVNKLRINFCTIFWMATNCGSSDFPASLELLIFLLQYFELLQAFFLFLWKGKRPLCSVGLDETRQESTSLLQSFSHPFGHNAELSIETLWELALNDQIQYYKMYVYQHEKSDIQVFCCSRSCFYANLQARIFPF